MVHVCKIHACVLQLLAILGEQFIVGDEICGVVISIRPTEDIISLWNRTASDPTITARIRSVLSLCVVKCSDWVVGLKHA